MLENKLKKINADYKKVTNLIKNKYYFVDQPEYFDIDSPNFDDFPYAYNICIQNDGKVVLCGYSGLYDSVNDLYYSVLKRFNSDGTVDETFTSPRFNNDVAKVQQQSDGKLIVAGYFSQAGDGDTYPLDSYDSILRLNTDGSIDDTFSPAGTFTWEMIVLSDDSILLADNNNYFKLNSDGSLNETFTDNIYSALVGIGFPQAKYFLECSNGKIFVAGNNYALRFNSDGTGDNTYAAVLPFPNIYSIAIDSNDRLYLAGDGLVKLDSSGEVDENFELTGDGFMWYYDPQIYSVAIQSNGKVLVGGWLSNYNSGDAESPNLTRTGHIARFNTDGSLDKTFATGSGFDASIEKIALDNNGNIYCVGPTFSFNGKTFTEEFNFGNEKIATGCVRLTPSGKLYGTPLKQDIKPVGISDGGNDIWDGGMLFNTDVNQSYGSINESDSIPFTHSVFCPEVNDYNIVDYGYQLAIDNEFDPINYNPTPRDGTVVASDEYFGEGSSYFTQLYPGLLVLGASGVDIDEFSISGGSGADGDGYCDVGSFNLTVNYKPYAVFYKSNYEFYGPSLVQMIIVPGNKEGIDQQVPDPLDSDDHILTGLADRDELYVLAFSRVDEQATTEATMIDIATQFLSLIVTPVKTCSNQSCGDSGFKCFVGTDNPCSCVQSTTFSGAYVPAIVVCNQRL